MNKKLERLQRMVHFLVRRKPDGKQNQSIEIYEKLKDMLENTKTLTTEEVEELGDAVRKTMDEIALEEKKQNAGSETLT